MFRLKPNLVAGVPAAVFLLAAGGVWVAAQICGAVPWRAALAGWLMLWLLLATVVGIVTAAAMRRAAWGLVYLIITVVVLAGVVGFVGVGLAAGVALGCLFMAWMLMWCAVARLLVRSGPGASVVVPLVLAGLCMASPVVAMPLVHGAAHWGEAGSLLWQERVVELVRHACPFFAVLDVMPGKIRSNWSTLPGMYRWSGLGQEVPMLLPNIWVCVGIYAAVAVVLWLPVWWRRGKA